MDWNINWSTHSDRQTPNNHNRMYQANVEKAEQGAHEHELTRKEMDALERKRRMTIVAIVIGTVGIILILVGVIYGAVKWSQRVRELKESDRLDFGDHLQEYNDDEDEGYSSEHAEFAVRTLIVTEQGAEREETKSVNQVAATDKLTGTGNVPELLPKVTVPVAENPAVQLPELIIETPPTLDESVTAAQVEADKTAERVGEAAKKSAQLTASAADNVAKDIIRKVDESLQPQPAAATSTLTSSATTEAEHAAKVAKDEEEIERVKAETEQAVAAQAKETAEGVKSATDELRRRVELQDAVSKAKEAVEKITKAKESLSKMSESEGLKEEMKSIKSLLDKTLQLANKIGSQNVDATGEALVSAVASVPEMAKELQKSVGDALAAAERIQNQAMAANNSTREQAMIDRRSRPNATEPELLAIQEPVEKADLNRDMARSLVSQVKDAAGFAKRIVEVSAKGTFSG